MTSSLVGRGARLAAWIGLGAAGALAAPAACLYPDYTFDEPEPSGSAGGGAGAEDCSNGDDDDGDGLVDCADPACGDFVCTTAVPEGWSGYFALFDGEPARDPGCPDAFAAGEPFVGNRGLSAPPARCTCSCGPAEGQACDALGDVLITVSDAPCGSAHVCAWELDKIPGWMPNTCKGPDGVFGGGTTCMPGGRCDASPDGRPCVASVSASAIAATGGACAANPVQVQTEDPRWTRLGRACAAAEPPGQGCNLGRVCVPRPSAPFEGGLCIAKDGDNPCPPGAYTERHVFFTGVEDDRGCKDDCACGAPSGGACPTTITLYSDDDRIDTCTTPLTELQTGGCEDLEGNPTIVGRKAMLPGAPTGGACAASGGTATGEARGAAPRTFCCQGAG
ncbi:MULTISPECIES: hypothetical protein [Sorangium]|uniref:Secreted protein n=1 Tax=Sorangium cellulosum TaxID=56 RepID=A0A4P2QNW3_SORCE|nr:MULTISPECIES: hypothetical protein [Sorangium]AUX31837.1 uncharacterized protein SOCE836_039700 [Sorangium cellulosum]WCQ91212.1 hypothetical protein NQZ70_03927 [Sorangium sp. Soce836]